MFCIQTIIDSLSSIGDIILDGLPDKFESLIAFVTRKFESMSIDEVVPLLAHETRIARKKTLASFVASINLTEGAKPNFSPNFSLSSAQEASGSSASSNPQANVDHGNSSSSSNSGLSYSNCNEGNRYVSAGVGRGGCGGGGWNFSCGGRSGGRGRSCCANIQCVMCLPYSGMHSVWLLISTFV